MTKTIREMCLRYTDLSEHDIEELIHTAKSLSVSAMYQDVDVFIDVYNKLTSEALVIHHTPPKTTKSLYKNKVVGETALRSNEPGVLRTLETGMNSNDLLAKTQENVLIRQKVYPIRNKQRVIAVLILENDISAEIKAHFEIDNEETAYRDVSTTLSAMSKLTDSITDQLDDAILIFDRNGILQQKNCAADQYYERLGYMEDIQGMHYDNLSLDQMMFDAIMYQIETGKQPIQLKKEVVIAGNYFIMKQIFVKEEDEQECRFILILHDITDIKVKEAEIVSKSVAIREIHHRVKNNLQSVVSLLRIQGRHSTSVEAQKILNESVSRILAIAATHELLSKQMEDGINLYMVIETVAYNIERCCTDCPKVAVRMDIDKRIYLDSDRTVALALVMNELLQNSYDHAFHPNESGEILLQIKEEKNIIHAEVTDNGHGFNVRKVSEKSLGLSIVKSYIKDKLRGKVTIESNEHGTKTMFDFKYNSIHATKK
ncbi:sensor histidine kinase [Listeria monocytogenes]|uniref:sensor histidine kinase n=1 Tax=Listeria monocytogenes TaxID=1639 RepID=UPI00083D7196|nr:sensor histidine kinase [Listeria monocytogenes]EKZ0228249.1 sensor histidine kinase [Listeria monocytogenes]NVU74661.1 sensor histidine kinase [Listeria monocytogenes]ODF34496.1 ethanolamine utilization protein [Listeria monocytogenes]